MASKRFEKGSSEWNLFQDFWGLCQKYWIPEDTDEYWDGVIKSEKEFYEKHKKTGLDNVFLEKIIWALIDTLELKNKENKEKS